MKIQELAIIFIIIILPISLVISEYTQFQIQTISLQTEYDTKLTSATYDAIKAFQLNTVNSSTSDLANSQMRDLEASINSFRNSLKSGFGLNGYTEEELNNYIPALVYTLYDGFYIYSPYENIVDDNGNIIEPHNKRENLYGIKPFINYSCRYKKGTTDVVITYALDNHVTVQGQMYNPDTMKVEYVNRKGYLIDGITFSGNENNYEIEYNEVKIEEEQLKENLGGKIYSYVKMNGTKYYLIPDYADGKDAIVYILNGVLSIQCTEEDEEEFAKWHNQINRNDYAKQYYKQAYGFTTWFKKTGLTSLTYADAYDEVINKDDEDNKKIELKQIWPDDNTVIFDFKASPTNTRNIENELSNFNQHRLSIIRHKIETNLAIAISNYNNYSGVSNIFKMPELTENEWHHLTHNIAMISFLQGIHIGGKVYNGYSIVTNSESEEVILEENIYFLGYNNDTNKYVYCRAYDKGLADGTITIDIGEYGANDYSAGRINLNFNRAILTDKDVSNYYYYPLRKYNASYSSIVMQDNVNAYEDIYEYINGQSDTLKQAFYTALGRERRNGTINIVAEDSQVPTYTVTYNANGGNGEPAAQTKIYGTDLKLSSIEPTRDGYNFLGWSTSPTAISKEYDAGGTFSTDANTTLYAVWQVKTYTITYNANGGVGEPAEQTKIHETYLTLSSTIPTRDGYDFLGWATSSIATIKEYDAGGTFNIDANTILYAVWQLRTYTITYNANGGVGEPAEQTKIHETYLTLSLTIPTRGGYKFLGWATSPTATSKEYDPGGTFTTDTNTTLYAVWEANVVTITYNANGGVGAPQAQDALEGQTTTLSTIVPTKDGYKFLGWATSQTAQTKEYDFGSEFTTNTNVTLYAVWQVEKFWYFKTGNGLAPGYTGFTNASYNSTQIYKKNLYSGGGSNGVIKSKEPIDVTNYNTVHFSGVTVAVNGKGNHHNTGVSLHVGPKSYYFGYTASSKYRYLMQDGSFTLDLSDVTGPVYLTVDSWDSGDWTQMIDVYIKNIWFD